MQNISDSNLQNARGDRIAVSPAEAARMAGVGRTTLYAALGTGELRSLKIGKRRLIMIKWLEDWLRAAEQYGAGDR